MDIFISVLLILAGALVLRGMADWLSIPAPVALAFGGTAVALVPGVPDVTIAPNLVLALFVAPILLDAAYDTSLRDLKRTWLPVTCLVIIAVGVTTAAVAGVAKLLVPDMPWPAAIALGAIVAPPDAASAIAILRRVRIPQVLVVILEGESLLNDASALLIYRLAVAVALGGTLHTAEFARVVALGIPGSVLAGWAIARINILLTSRVTDTPTSIILQFLATFGVWVLAERLDLSPIITVVTHAITTARIAPRIVPASVRIPSYAVWETVVLVLNIFAFVLIGLELKPILLQLSGAEVQRYIAIAFVVLLTTIVARIVWVMSYNTVARAWVRYQDARGQPVVVRPTKKGGVIIAWCGMRGIVTLAAALALPADMPQRGVILFTAFVVVLGTLAIQGLTLKPLIKFLSLPVDDTVDREVGSAWSELALAVQGHLRDNQHPDSQRLAAYFAEGQDGYKSAKKFEKIRAEALAMQRVKLLQLRSEGKIGDTAFHMVEEELDWSEVAAQRRSGVR
jgi:CPA1 family monovalent cation:H+ antiporter